MHIRHLGAIVFTLVVLTVSCKKEEEPTINSCLNGQLDSGETAVDCGGSCGPCPATVFPYATFNVNGTAMTAHVKQLYYSNGWLLHVGNDTISILMNLGNNGAVGTYPMPQAGCTSTYNAVNYTELASGFYSISQHDIAAQRMSGFFQGKFVQPSVPGDTLYVTNGSFEDLSY